jgi:hypothetical protein
VGFSATFTGFVIFLGIGTSFGFGGGSVFSLATTGAGLGVSEARTFFSSVWTLGGRGIEETAVAWMAPATASSCPHGFDGG